MTEIIAIFNDASKGQDSLATLSFAKNGAVAKPQKASNSPFLFCHHYTSERCIPPEGRYLW